MLQIAPPRSLPSLRAWPLPRSLPWLRTWPLPGSLPSLRAWPLPLLLALTAALGPACSHDPGPVAVRASLCDDLSGDPRPAGDLADLRCAKQARLRVYTNEIANTSVDRCIDLGAATRLEDLFASSGSRSDGGGAGPVPFGSAARNARVAVEVNLYAPGAADCPAEAPLVGQGLSAFVDLGSSPPPTLAIPLAARKACADASDRVDLDVRYLEDLTAAPIPALALADIYPYDLALKTSGACRAPDDFRGERRLFAAAQQFDGATPTAHVSGSVFFDRSHFAGCTAAHVEDGDGGLDACLDDSRAIFLLHDDHLGKVRAANRALPDGADGALVVRVVDGAGHALAGARLSYALGGPRSVADYVLDAAWDHIAASSDGTSTAGGGVAVFRSALTGPYVVDFGDGTSRTFHAGADYDTGSVTTIVIRR
jgi:hypothetical protein